MNLPRTDEDTLLLTFDDGPHPQHTVTVLRLLRRYNARAIFFVVGSRIERAPFLLKRIRDDGHLIGNHGVDWQLDFRPRLLKQARRQIGLVAFDQALANLSALRKEERVRHRAADQ